MHGVSLAFLAPILLAPLAEPQRRSLLLPRGVGALTSTGLGLLDLQQEDDDGQQVGDIPQDAENIHGAGGAPPEGREQGVFCRQGGRGQGVFHP